MAKIDTSGIPNTRQNGRTATIVEAIASNLDTLETDVTANVVTVGAEQSADPADPADGTYVIWMSDGTGAGDAGDIMIKITSATVTKTTTLVDYSAIV